VVLEGRFGGTEGLAFTPAGELYLTGDRALWRLGADGTLTRIVDLTSTVGVAPIGKRDVLVAEFGPAIRLTAGETDDGLVLRVTPEGRVDTLARGLADPNFVLPLPDGTILAADDFSTRIDRILADGRVERFTDAIKFPNGMVLAPDRSALYIAQIFRQIDPITFDDRVWRLPLRDLRPAGPPEPVFHTGGAGGNDGLAMDADGRVYVASNREQRIWRFDPRDGSAVLVAEGIQTASLAFGVEPGDPQSLYATEGRGGRVFRIRVGARGAPPP